MCRSVLPWDNAARRVERAGSERCGTSDINAVLHHLAPDQRQIDAARGGK
jgi:hypothetical protein